MVRWAVRLGGSLGVECDGVPTRLRTRQQSLLLGLLVANAPKPLDRAAIATLLWPNAPRANALTYLRRAVMELRDLGIDIVATRGDLSLGSEAVRSDLFDAYPTGQPWLEGMNHPAADEVRRLITLRREQAQGPHPPAASFSDEGWLGESLLQVRPDIAVEVIAQRWGDLETNRSPSDVLSLYERALAASPDETSARGRVLFAAARAYMFLTRYRRAEQYLEEALEISLRLGDQSLQGNVLSSLGFLFMETRRWDFALGTAMRAVEIADRFEDKRIAAAVHNNVAGIMWHLLDFEGARRHYVRAAEVALNLPTRLAVLSNHAYIWAVFGVPFDLPNEMPEESAFGVGLGGTNYAYFQLSVHLGRGEFREAAPWAARHLELNAAEGKERYQCISLDCAAIVFAKLGLRAEAAASVRLGSRLRWSLGHRRSPAESLAIRRHVSGDYFSEATTDAFSSLNADEPDEVARKISSRLRRCLNAR